MILAEPAGCEPRGGKSAEFHGQACPRGGDGENISVTVRRDIAGALSACIEQD